MKKEERQDNSRLLALEINAYLKKIYKTMKPKKHLQPQSVSPGQLILKHASLGATKMWEFRPNTREEAAKGNVGKITVVTRGLEHNAVRKQRALLIAAEYYVYHSFANDHDNALYRSITNQNQYTDTIKRMLGMSNAHEMRDHAIRYVIEEIKEHNTAHFSGDGWHTSIAKLKAHHPRIAEALGSSQETFHRIFRKQHQKFDHDMLKQEDDLVRKEIEDIDHLLGLLDKQKSRRKDDKLKKLINIHEQNLITFRDVLQKILSNMDAWILVDKKEHAALRKKAGLTPADLQRLLLAEAEAEQIDINKIHILFRYFKKEKINILQDMELVDKLSAHMQHKRGQA